MSKKCKENNNICCDAVNCVYHTTDCKCTAESIKVSNAAACSCSQTCCSTFKMRNKDTGAV